MHVQKPDTPRILFVDDELPLRTVITRILGRRGLNVESVSNAVTAVERLQEFEYDLLLTDFQMPDMDGFELLAYVRENHPDLPAVMMTGHASVQHAVKAMHSGAVDYLPKPFAPDALAERVLEQIASRKAQRGSSARGIGARGGQSVGKRSSSRKPAKRAVEFIGEHPSIVSLRELSGRLSQSLAPVFIHGESGTGKEVLSRYIHQQSGRTGPFVAVNCANLPRELVESVLFGHRKGAFTGATDSHTGVFEEANGGTLLLDEVTEIDPALQAKLLRVLQEGEIQPVGAPRPTSIDVRVLATTNRDVASAIEAGTFRDDLYHRLAVFPVAIPPLSDRGDDILLLASRFVEKYCALYGHEPKEIAGPLAERLLASEWPGNVRQLENMIHRGVVLSAERPIVAINDVDHSFLHDAVPFSGSSLAARPRAISTLDEMERDMILRALRDMDGNQVHAAERLGISDRTIRNKLKRYREEGYIA